MLLADQTDSLLPVWNQQQCQRSSPEHHDVSVQKLHQSNEEVNIWAGWRVKRPNSLLVRGKGTCSTDVYYFCLCAAQILLCGLLKMNLMSFWLNVHFVAVLRLLIIITWSSSADGFCPVVMIYYLIKSSVSSALTSSLSLDTDQSRRPPRFTSSLHECYVGSCTATNDFY